MDAMSHGDMVRRFDAYYESAGASALRELELRALGCSYGGNSFTDVHGARRLGEELELSPESVLLDIGTGAGWPGLFLAKESGCQVVLSDLAAQGLCYARTRAVAEDVSALTVTARASQLPFRSAMFHAVTHSDVLC